MNMEITKGLSLFNMEFLSSVTAMVLAVNLITQVIKEIFLREDISGKVPKILTLMASFIVVGMNHQRLWLDNPNIFHNSLAELIFLIFLNGILITALAMGNYKVLNLTKEREVKSMENKLKMEERKNYFQRK
ncbi:hypothetical protein [Inediibacterium massiliense]|uniref:hypothetical protein n=1 Tax=Inediibacterium massiliense TaxID=1658111 RepID=UPI0006B568A3|nr:hypothetical protein [Inediibacterium massiliense]